MLHGCPVLVGLLIVCSHGAEGFHERSIRKAGEEEMALGTFHGAIRPHKRIIGDLQLRSRI